MRRTGWFVMLSLCLVGCGGGGDTPDLGTVTGTVTLDDKPLEGASVTFTPEAGGRGAVGTTDGGGDYELMYSPGNYGTVPGKYKVSITTAGTKTGADGNDIEVPETVPMEYNVQTTLTADVQAGSNSFDFPLKSGGAIYSPSDDDDDPQQRSLDCGP